MHYITKLNYQNIFNLPISWLHIDIISSNIVLFKLYSRI